MRVPSLHPRVLSQGPENLIVNPFISIRGTEASKESLNGDGSRTLWKFLDLPSKKNIGSKMVTLKGPKYPFQIGFTASSILKGKISNLANPGPVHFTKTERSVLVSLRQKELW